MLTTSSGMWYVITLDKYRASVYVLLYCRDIVVVALCVSSGAVFNASHCWPYFCDYIYGTIHCSYLLDFH